jgi:O-antigen/teichoic acid export membrane protein
MPSAISEVRKLFGATSLKASLVANFAGKAWAAGLGLLFIPVYVRYLGIEAYGLVGFFTTLTMLAAAFDLGLSTTLNRSLAQATTQSNGVNDSHDLLFSMELVYWPLMVGVALTVALLAPWLGGSWLNPQALGVKTTVDAVILLAIAGLFQWPQALYGGGLMGLQKQVAYNAVQFAFATLRVVGAVAVLAWVSSTIIAFFWWQIAVSLVQTVVLAGMLHRSLYRGMRPQFRLSTLRSVGHFAVGMSGVSLSVLCLTTLDKVLLSRLLSLADFGYYMLASTLAGGLSLIVSPVFQAVFPKLSGLVHSGDYSRLCAAYHKYCQLMSVLLAPVSFVLVVYSKPILEIWTGNAVTAERTYVLLSLLAFGNAINGLINVPYSLMLAQGWTKWIVAHSLIASAIVAPVLYWTVPLYGAVAAALMLIAINVIMLFTLMIPHHTLMMPGQIKIWYVKDTVVPVAVAVAISSAGFGCVIAMREQGSSVLVLVIAGAFALLSTLGAGVMAPSLRPFVRRLVTRLVVRNTADQNK